MKIKLSTLIILYTRYLKEKTYFKIFNNKVYGVSSKYGNYAVSQDFSNEIKKYIK